MSARPLGGGLVVSADGLVVLHHDSLEGISAEARSLRTASLLAISMRLGIALAAGDLLVTLSDGSVVYFDDPEGS